MEKNDIYKRLEDDFTSTFIYELMPGVLHNFANPLNGIMGRSKLLQRRIDDTVKKIHEKYPNVGNELQDELQRIKNDIRSVNKESESFFEMFKDASAKFYALAAKGEDRINLSQLLAAEMRFANFYLEFKHEIVKKIEFDNDIQEIKGNLAELSLVFWRIIRFAMTRAVKSREKSFHIKTQGHDNNLIILIQYTFDDVQDRDIENIIRVSEGKNVDLEDAGLERGFLLSLGILKKYKAHLKFLVQEGIYTISISIPYGAKGI